VFNRISNHSKSTTLSRYNLFSIEFLKSNSMECCRSKSTNILWTHYINSATKHNRFTRFAYLFVYSSVGSTFHLVFQNQNTREQEQTWENKPTAQLTGNQLPQSTDSNTQSFLFQPQTWQSKIHFLKSLFNFSLFKIASQTFQNQQPLISVDNKNRLSTGMAMILEIYLFILLQ
jgi:hypothetical protein